ncbi:EexN family lipoprotein [Pseudomonas syringae]|uniref:EexN family lipoprotein n=1 Tax=Pseudomonas syringae TaxID=317 RepID=UPI0027400997|nr:EexN family lipoprotein [Pseudomonas syringae]MDP5168591.1 EexN family lipoprotein [Pseudomonas syringae pv. aptata str. DSM 50252]
MNRLTGCSIVITTTLFLAACGKPPSHSIEYYKQHSAERAAMLEKCRADPDLATKTTDCTSAADAEATSGSFTPSKPRAW